MAQNSNGEDTRIVDVLRTLEAAGRLPSSDVEDLDEVFGRENWVVGQNPDLERFFEAQQSKQSYFDGLSANTISRLSASAHQTDVMLSILRPLLSVALDHEKRYKQVMGPIASKLGKGVATLPDEILAMIFEVAVRMEKHNGRIQARFLSHVSRRFRKVALGEHRIWTTLCSFASSKELRTFISRSGTRPLFDVFFRIGAANTIERWNTFVKICSPALSRWRILTFGAFVTSKTDNFSHDSLVEIYLRGNKVDLPSLQELRYESSQTYNIPSPRPLSWATPNLQSLHFSRHLPHASPSFLSVTSVTLDENLDGYLKELEQLLIFLSSLPKLGYLDLTLHSTDVVKLKRPPQFPESKCPSLKSFRLRFPSFKMLPHRQNSTVVGAFLNSLLMPDLEEYSIFISFRSARNDEGDCTELIPHLAVALLPSQFSDPFSQLSSLNFSITYEPKPAPVETWLPSVNSNNLPTTFTIPLDRIPSVSKLTISAVTQIAFTVAEDPSMVKGKQKRKKISKKLVLSRPMICLREIRFSGCEDLKADDLRTAVQSLKGAEVWEALERVFVENCGSVEYGEALSVVGEERLRFLV